MTTMTPFKIQLAGGTKSQAPTGEKCLDYQEDKGQRWISGLAQRLLPQD